MSTMFIAKSDKETKAVSNVLVKRGKEWNGPDKMYLIRSTYSRWSQLVRRHEFRTWFARLRTDAFSSDRIRIAARADFPSGSKSGR